MKSKVKNESFDERELEHKSIIKIGNVSCEFDFHIHGLCKLLYLFIILKYTYLNEWCPIIFIHEMNNLHNHKACAQFYAVKPSFVQFIT